GQLEIGQFLYNQIFKEMQPSELKSPHGEQVDVRIITEDEHIARLPWVLLAHKGVFLSATGWSIAIARTINIKDCRLPDKPKMLVIAPEPAGMEKTKASAHLETLEYRLSLFDPHFTWDGHLKKVATWEDFREQLKVFTPDIIYYYGHGIGDEYASRLIFVSGEQSRPVEKPVADFALCLRAMEMPPKLVYLNCCSGDAGGFLGAGWQLGEIVPAVITNRTVAYIDAAQAQGLAIWQAILLDGKPPHLAIADIRSKLVELDMSLGDARWMTPVLHCHYAEWKSKPPERVDPLEQDPHWHLKLNRVMQFGTVTYQTRQMLREQRPRSLAYVWYGQEGQGIDLFHKRLKVELQEDLANHAHFREIRPAWPMDLQDPDRSFEDMLTEAFDVQSFRDIPRCIRSYTRGASGRQTLVYIRHQPVFSSELINPWRLKQYLLWWDRKFVPFLKDQFYGLLTVSFVVKNPAKFRKAMLEKQRLDDLELTRHTIFKLLDEMERIGMNDLADFLKSHNIRLPRERKDRILQDILERTNGHYELTISALKKLVERAWDEAEEQPAAEGDEEDEYDY
ncbi:MAG: hypothetical protein ACE5I1_27775, partial [bacterium]